MQHERRDYDDDNLAELWRSGQLRRTEDIYFWFTHFFERQRRLKSSDSRLQYPQRRATALVWKLLDAITRGGERFIESRGGNMSDGKHLRKWAAQVARQAGEETGRCRGTALAKHSGILGTARR
jgi:hypothetical protein